MDYVGRIFRPPSEAQSLLLQVTVGCSWNRCTYCAMYRDPEQRFRAKPFDTVAADIEEAVAAGRPIPRVFLCDGDALVLSTPKLQRILARLRERLPSVRRVGIYGDARTILRKSVAELGELRELGLGIVYHGVESGDETTLQRIEKGSTRDETAAAAHRLREAGIRHSVIVMLGIGGTERTREHAAATADLITEMDPPYVGALTTTLVPGTPLDAAAQRGEFTLPDPWGMLAELETLVARSRPTRCTFHANHASNYLPLRLNLPADREQGLSRIRQALETRDPSLLVPEYRRGL
ncbi:radical SAM protein [bacterium]|nr:radical SAM protein [bacterium]